MAIASKLNQSVVVHKMNQQFAVWVAWFITFLYIEAVVSQEIQIQEQAYSVTEDVSRDYLVLKVCVKGTNLQNQTYNIRIQTEQLLNNSAIDGEDYNGIDDQLTLSGPETDTECTCVEVFEDEIAESDEMFGLRISGSPLITRDSVNVFIEDNDGISFTFTGDSPRVNENMVTFELQFNSGVVSATCEVVGHGSMDCSDGMATFSLPIEDISLFQPRITTANAQGIEEISLDPNRVFRTANHSVCFVHLINEGVTFDRSTGDVTFEWVWTGTEGRTFCLLDTRPIERCISPYTVSGLAPGDYTMMMRIRNRGVCPRINREISFTIPAI